MKKEIHLKQARGKKTYVKSILLPSGNLVVPKIMKRNPFVSCWVEIVPGSSDYKRWWPMREKERDPRTYDEYKKWLSENHQDLLHTLNGVYKEN